MPIIAKAYTCGIIFVTVIYKCIWNILADCTRYHNRTFHLITISFQVLRPENNGICRSRFTDPAGIERGTGIQFLPKCEFPCFDCRIFGMCVCVFFGIIPAAEPISQANHFRIRSGLFRYRSGFNKLRSAIGSAFAVFIKDKPVAFRRIDRECHITEYCDFCFILIYVSFFIIDYFIAAFRNQPAHKGMLIVLRFISHVNRIDDLRIRSGRTVTVTDNILTNGNISVNEIIDSVLFCKYSIISNRISSTVRCHFNIMNAFFQYCFDITANIRDGHRGKCFVRQFIILIICPSEENHTGRQRTRTRIINDSIKLVLIFKIFEFHQHRGNGMFRVSADEIDFQTCVFSLFHHCIDREAIRFKTKAGQLACFIGVESCLNLFRFSVGIMNQLQPVSRFQIQRNTQPDPYIHRLAGFGLPFLTVCIVHGNVIASDFPLYDVRLRFFASSLFGGAHLRPSHFILPILFRFQPFVGKIDPAVCGQDVIDAADDNAESILRLHLRRHNSFADLNRFRRINNDVCFV